MLNSNDKSSTCVIQKVTNLYLFLNLKMYYFIIEVSCYIHKKYNINLNKKPILLLIKKYKEF